MKRLIQSDDIWTPYWRGKPATTGYPVSDPTALGYWQQFFSARHANARMLDIGTGFLDVPLIARQVSAHFELHAIDQADIDTRKIYGSETIRFRRARADDTGYPDAHFDAVTGSYALEYTALKDGSLDDDALGRTLAEIHRVMKPGAVGCFLMHHPDSTTSRQVRHDLLELHAIPDFGVFAGARECLRDSSQEKLMALHEAVERLTSRHARAGNTVARGFQTVFQVAERRGSAVGLDLLGQFEKSILNDVARFEAMQTASLLDPARLRKVLVDNDLEVTQSREVNDGAKISGWGIRIRKGA